MPYEVRFTDEINKGVIVVEDREINSDATSLSFPGRGVTNYGKVIAENLLQMLENYAFSVPPDNPVEGQTWYDNTSGIDQLKIYDGTRWIPASGIFKGASAPEVASAIAGDLWVDTDSQQLYLNSGAGWILVGPEFSGGSATGPRSALLTGTDNINYTVLILDVNQIPIVILSGNEFTPKTNIAGFNTIRQGVNLSTRTLNGSQLKYRGIAESAETLRIGNNNVNSINFMRSDLDTSTSGQLSVRNNRGIQVGDSNQIAMFAAGERGVIRNNFSGSSLDLEVKQGTNFLSGLRVTTDAITGNLDVRVGNPANPTTTLDVYGVLNVEDSAVVKSTAETTELNEGALQVSGGASVAKNVQIGGALTVAAGITLEDDITGNSSDLIDFNTITANSFIGNLQGSVVGTLQGSASSATRLISATSFEITGDVTASPILFDGTGNLTKVFDTTLSNDFIAGKQSVPNPQRDDEIIINRISGDTGLYKIAQRDIIKNIPTNPIGMFVPFGGQTPPSGWLLCDGSIVNKSDYQDLFDIIGYAFLDEVEVGNRGFTPSNQFFALPDLRGRFPLGLDSMGGIAADRVTDLAADTLGNTGGTEVKDVSTSNLPAHEHNLRSSGLNAKQYFAIRDVELDTQNDSPEVTDLSISTGTSNVSGIPTSGGIIGGGVSGNGDYRTVAGEELGVPLGVMNPYVAVNYIIWTGGL